jgi:hypothetical protein
MIRTPLAAALAAGLLWGADSPAFAEDPAQASVSPQTQKINELIAKGYAEAPKGGIKKPADRASDVEFVRRAFIDLIGRIPTPEEVLDFENDKKGGDKRARLVYRLLNETSYTPNDRGGKPAKSIPGLKKVPVDYNDAYAENFAELWTTWMLTRSNTHQLYRNQFHNWLAGKFAASTKYPNGTPWNVIVEELISATGKTNENGAVVFTIRHLGDPIAAEMGAKPNFDKDGKFDAVPITSRITRLFLGIKTQCVQCHDHPFNKEYVQSDFWGVNAFYRQTDRSGSTNPNARNLAPGIDPPQLTLSDVPGWNAPGMVLYERRDGQRKASFPIMLKNLAQAQNFEVSTKRLVSGDIPAGLEGKTRRQILAQWVTEHDNFGREFVNRMWGHLFGRGLNKEPSVDDFSIDNVVVHPELLDYLAAEFKKYNYDPKKLLEWICTSNVYQLSHVARKEYADQIFDPYFARMPLKSLAPEVMFDSLAVATRLETRKDEKAYKALKAAWGQKLTQNFGDDEGNEINFNGTVVQALLMMNGKEINTEIGSAKKGSGGVVEDVVSRNSTPSAIYNELFLMTLSRHPTPAEISKLEVVRNGHGTVEIGSGSSGGTGGTGSNPPPKGTKPPPKVLVPGAAANDVAFYQDVFWALLNSSEFMLNH